MQLEKAQRRKRRNAKSTASLLSRQPPQKKLSDMNIMWRASAMESKKKGDLGRDGVHANQKVTNGDHHAMFRNSTNLLGHIVHDHNMHVSTDANIILRTLRAKHLLLGKVKESKRRAMNDMAERSRSAKAEHERKQLIEAQGVKKRWPTIGLVPKLKPHNEVQKQGSDEINQMQSWCNVVQKF